MPTRKPYDGLFIFLVMLAVVLGALGIASGNWALIVIAAVCIAVAVAKRSRL